MIDRRAFISTLGGAAAVEALSSEALADALEWHMIQQLEQPARTAPPLDAPAPGALSRRGVGGLFVAGRPGPDGQRVLTKLEPMPPKPTLVDFFALRFAPANHVLQSATRALKTGMSEETVLACLLHDVVLSLIKPDHGWWGAQLFEPYVAEKVSWAIRYHQALRFYPDASVGYEYPELYYRIFGKDYVPDPHVEQAYKFAKSHKWYMEARLITVNDLYSFDPNARVSIDPFVDIIGRHFKQPKEGLGHDGSPVAHMWRTIARPDMPL
jgi:hypothetical protein